jgi:hypothetical protein
MTPLDLSGKPPRSGHDRVAGIAFLPRTIDKLRALMPGGNHGVYKIPGISVRMIETLEFDEKSLAEVVASAASEEEVGAWVSDRAGAERIAAWNAVYTRPIQSAEQRAEMEKRYPFMKDRPDVTTLVDMLDLDDGRPVHGRGR